MAEISFVRVTKGPGGYNIELLLREKVIVDGDEVIRILGHANVVLGPDTPPANAKAEIIATAQGIMEEHKAAKAVREKLDQVQWPEIT